MADPPGAMRWTTADLKALPDDELRRYEIIVGELFITQPETEHQAVCARCTIAIGVWNDQTQLGRIFIAPGIIFSESDAVAPDLMWASHERLAAIERGDDPHFHGAPELVIEVLSPGATNERRDREAKLKLHSIYGVLEYWIVDWRTQTLAVYRRQDAQLALAATLTRDDILTSPVLPGFALPVATLFEK